MGYKLDNGYSSFRLSRDDFTTAEAAADEGMSPGTGDAYNIIQM